MFWSTQEDQDNINPIKSPDIAYIDSQDYRYWRYWYYESSANTDTKILNLASYDTLIRLVL